MKIIQCDTVVKIQQAACQNLTGLTASLSRNGQTTVVVPAVADTTPNTIKLTIPPNLAQGVWKLTVTTPLCSCASERVFINNCAPLGLLGKHTETTGVNSPTPDCCT